MEQRIGDTREEFQQLFGIYWPIAAAVFVVVAVVLFAVWRFRSGEREDGGEHPAARSAARSGDGT